MFRHQVNHAQMEQVLGQFDATTEAIRGIETKMTHMQGYLLDGKRQQERITQQAEDATKIMDKLSSALVDTSNEVIDNCATALDTFAGLIENLEKSALKLGPMNALKELQHELAPLLVPIVVLVMVLTICNCYFGFVLAGDEELVNTFALSALFGQVLAGDDTTDEEKYQDDTNILMFFAIFHLVLICIAMIYLLVEGLRRFIANPVLVIEEAGDDESMTESVSDDDNPMFSASSGERPDEDQFDDNLSSADAPGPLEQFSEAEDGLRTSPSKKPSARSVQVNELTAEFFDADKDTVHRVEGDSPFSPTSPAVGQFPPSSSTRSVGSKDQSQRTNRREKRSSTGEDKERKKTEMEKKSQTNRTPVSGVLRSLQKSASSFAEKRKANTMDNLSKALSSLGGVSDWEELQGVKMPGQHLLVETLSLTDAKNRVKTLQAEGCDGFCYQPEGESDGLFQVHFGIKGQGELVTDSAWRTVAAVRRSKKLSNNHEAI